ncbi:HPr(Ser) kinase/phosphatase [Spiroplasma endosymbiont of Labia minor]|uniref:HPr(Ser) kinase/phosphatase n=1 Tax=Spiroplasma endosymbiont of Labia minor TaxID=3066305 RepID=UPI0030D5C7C3
MKLKVSNLIERFNLEVLSGNKETLQTTINLYGLNRAGLELAGYFEDKKKFSRVVLISTKEFNFIKSFSEDERKRRYKKLIKSSVPLIIITEKFLDNTLIEVAKETDFPIVKTHEQSTTEFTQHVLNYMDNFFAPQIELHGSMVSIYGKGVLIIGKSGIGKSEIAIDLIEKNHMFVGDDRIVMIRKGNSIIARVHEILKNLIEVRGIGIINIVTANGYQSIMEESKLDLVIELSKFISNNDVYDRIGLDYETYDVLGLKIPYINIPVSSGRNIATIVETAVAQLKINLAIPDNDMVGILEKRVQKYQREQKDD